MNKVFGRLHLPARPALNLQAKLTLFAAVLLLSALGATSLVASYLLDELAESAARARLDHAAEVVTAEYEALLGNARITAEAIAAWPLQERPGTLDTLTALTAVLRRSPFVRTVLRTGAADLIALVGSDGVPLVALDRGQVATTNVTVSDATVASALAGSGVEGLELADGALRAVVTRPLQTGDDVAAIVLVASLLDDSLADRLKAATEFDITYYAEGRPIATSARRPDGTRPVNAPADADVVSAVVGQAQVVEQVQRGVGGHRVIVRYYPLYGVSDTPVGMFGISAPVALLYEARTRMLLLFTLVVAGVLVVALVAAAYVARALLRPLRALVQAVQRIGEGDLVTPIYCESAEEVGSLSRAAEDMRLRLLRHADEEAELDRLKDQYLFNVAHELKTPLTSLTATVQVLAEAGETLPAAERAHLVGVLRRSTARLQALVDNILDLGSVRAGRFSVSPHPIALDAVAADAIASIQPLLDARQQRVECRFGPSPPVVQADARRLLQVLVNLLSNATKFGADRDVIRLEAVRQDSQVRVSVTDHGPGIPAAEQAHLFEAYFRSAMARELTPGVGLGLAVVKAIVEAHGGQVGIDSVPGRGTTTWFTLPVAAAEPAGGGPTATPPAVALSSASGGGGAE